MLNFALSLSLVLFVFTIPFQKSTIKMVNPPECGLTQLSLPTKHSEKSENLTCNQQKKQCLNYEPEPIQLQGKLVKRTFVNASNRRQTVYLLELNKPICINEDRNNEFNIQQKNVRRIQLVLSNYNRAKRFVEKFVELEGTLFGAHTQNHFTEVLMSVDKIKVPK